MRYLLAGLLFLLLAACAASTGPSKPDYQQLRQQLGQLPGAVVAADGSPSFSYPGQVMFGTLAVLPMPGGPRLLNPLAEFLKQNPQLAWQVDVRAQTIYGRDYDQTLAEKRSELLASYLQSKGAKLQKLNFQPSSSEGEQLVFTLLGPTTSN